MTTDPGVGPPPCEILAYGTTTCAEAGLQMDKRVVLHYRKSTGFVPITCLGETNHFVDRADVVN